MQFVIITSFTFTWSFASLLKIDRYDQRWNSSVSITWIAPFIYVLSLDFWTLSLTATLRSFSCFLISYGVFVEYFFCLFLFFSRDLSISNFFILPLLLRICFYHCKRTMLKINDWAYIEVSGIKIKFCLCIYVYVHFVYAQFTYAVSNH